MKNKSKREKKQIQSNHIYIHSSVLLDADDETFKGYYEDNVHYQVYGSNEAINAIWERAKKLSLQ